jgi:hypothetical protein
MGQGSMLDSIHIQPSTLVQRRDDVVFTPIDDELMMIDARRDVGYSLNSSASKVWEMIATPVSVETICVRLCKQYRVDEQTCLREVSSVLEKLYNAGLIEIKDGAVP